jgi:type IV secretory pathway VirB2 component (pilin)
VKTLKFRNIVRQAMKLPVSLAFMVITAASQALAGTPLDAGITTPVNNFVTLVCNVLKVIQGPIGTMLVIAVALTAVVLKITGSRNFSTYGMAAVYGTIGLSIVKTFVTIAALSNTAVAGINSCVL